MRASRQSLLEIGLGNAMYIKFALAENTPMTYEVENFVHACRENFRRSQGVGFDEHHSTRKPL